MAQEKVEDILCSFITRLRKYGHTHGLQIVLPLAAEKAFIEEMGDFAHWFVDEGKLHMYWSGGVECKIVKRD